MEGGNRGWGGVCVKINFGTKQKKINKLKDERKVEPNEG